MKPINSLYANTVDKFIMPHPSNSHQWLYNKKQLPTTDVIIDPKLTAVLRPHQKEGVIFLYECILGFRDYGGLGAILADEMGLGKTLQCITLVWTLYKQGPYGGIPILKKILIITPSSLVKNWLKEFKKWLGFDKLSVFAVDQQNKIQEFLHSRLSPVLLISYEMFVRNYELLSDVNFDLIICDEGHRLKNINIKTTNLLMGLQTPRRILLTGTPIQNDLKEFYSIVEFCNPGILGSPSQFHRIFEEPIIQSRQPNATAEAKCLGKDRAQELFSLTSSFVLRRTQEIINKYLPTKLEQVVFCPTSPLQAELYSEILGCKSVRACLTSFSTVDTGHHLMCITALRKLCNHPLLLYLKSTEAEETNICNTVKDALYQEISSSFPKDFENVNLSVTSGKLKVVSQLLESMFADSRKEKIVLVSHFTQTLDILQKYCRLKGYSFVRLDGSTPASSRQNIVDSFNSPYSNHFLKLVELD
ncbi:DNA repair and recombination protein RAD54B-like isoform X1 [Centruroides sculpturatus]|uniref:DNA repair and recombination protein RAD54B-like isoform X1 n=1 Tax=Centruroides sculpturatus TaxID=218467 RepID=UPI000C6CE9BD|nr:DNA repair and recombination protein RAD54B-like isoform X1 [Centruroides sculpturatus]